MVIKLHRKMGENTERRKGTEAVTEKQKVGFVSPFGLKSELNPDISFVYLLETKGKSWI